jgi:hypothetical protein
MREAISPSSPNQEGRGTESCVGSGAYPGAYAFEADDWVRGYPIHSLFMLYGAQFCRSWPALALSTNRVSKRSLTLRLSPWIAPSG